MKPHPLHRLPAPLEAAVQRLKLAAREAVERTIESLGLAALSATHAFQRDGLLGAQFELNRKSAVFVLTFNDAFDDRMLRELGGTSTSAGAAPPAAGAAEGTRWDDLGLVDDREVEAQITADRFSMEMSVACEWELRELDAYTGALLAEADGEPARNPLRPDAIGHAMVRAIDAVSDRPEVRKVLISELSRSLSGLLRTAYAGIVADWRHAGMRPLSLSARIRAGRAEPGSDSRTRGTTGTDTSASGTESGSGASVSAPAGSRWGTRADPGGSAAGPSRSSRGAALGTPMGSIDPDLVSVIRRLAQAAPNVEAGRAGVQAPPAAGEPAAAHGAAAEAPQALPNLIRAHREELRQAASGTVHHLVIDVIGFLFDQILADPKVPPQMARQIARLQLPVLRAALGDPAFFSSHRHPVRRFVNRIASLGAGFENFEDEVGKAFLDKVRVLVQGVVEGDFENLELFEQQLATLEAHVAELAVRELQASGSATELLSVKEDQARLRQLYAQRLASELKDVEGPAFLREFISGVWSQVLLHAAEQHGMESPQVQQLRRVARELLLSVHPKANAVQRKAFLAELPRLMHDLTEGMNLIAWPEAQRRIFFGQLMPAHAEALKSTTGRQLDINLLTRRVETALEKPAPSPDDVRAMARLPLPAEALTPASFSADEARRVGLVDEASVDWNGLLDVDLDALQAQRQASDAAAWPLPGLPAITDAPEPTQGRALADTLQVGFAYQMHLGGRWQRVRLSHVSPGRSFFMFTHGSGHKQTLSLTQRMLMRLCEAGRLRAFEEATLLDRATARARRQLAELGPQGRSQATPAAPASPPGS